MVAVSRAHPLAGAKRIALAELAAEPFIFYPRRNGRALYDAIIFACEAAGFTPQIAQDAPQLTSVVNLVATGIAIAIVPRSMSRLATDDVRYVPISGNAPTATMSLARARKTESPLSDAFIELVLARSPPDDAPG